MTFFMVDKNEWSFGPPEAGGYAELFRQMADRTAVRIRQGPWNIVAKKKNLPIVYWQVF